MKKMSRHLAKKEKLLKRILKIVSVMLSCLHINDNYNDSLKGPFKYDYMISHLRWGGCQKSCGDHYQDNKKKYMKEG